jgi:hypothetical protein
MKTQRNNASVHDFLANVEPARRREDAAVLLALMQELSGEEAAMWGPSIVGFGQYHYRYESGREGDWCRIGFSPRKSSLSLYIMNGFSDYEELLADLGKHKLGKSCLYINKLADVDLEVLRQLVSASLRFMEEKYPRTPA